MRAGDARSFAADFFGFAPRRVMLATIVVGMGALVEGLGIMLLVPLFAAVTGPDGDRIAQAATWLFDRVGLSGRSDRLAVIMMLFGVLMIVRTALLARRQVLLAQLELDYLARIQQRLVTRLAGARWERVARLRHARVVQALGSDVARVGEAALGLLQSLVACAMLVVQVALAMWLSPGLTIVALLLFALAGAMTRKLLHAARAMGDAVTGLHLRLLDNTGQFLGSLKLSASQNLQHAFVADFTRALDQSNARELAFVDDQNAMRMRLTVMAALVGGVTAYVGFAWLAVAPTSVVVLLLILSRMGGPLGLLQSQSVSFVRALPAYRNLRALEKDLGGRMRLEGGRPRAVVARGNVPDGDVLFDDVVYRHGSASAQGWSGGVDGLSLMLKRGAMTGVAGASGAGKTTFADLLVGLYRPERGVISVGGAIVDLVAMTAWRDRLAYVSQDPFLLHDSVRANLAWGTGADEAAMDAALAIAGADALVARLAQGLDTLVGERGALLSGGERQRLAIARAVLRDPALLILDEATNAIDVAAETALLARLRSARPALTIVSIAHRSETLAQCDHVHVLSHGRVIASGSFAIVAPYLGDDGFTPDRASGLHAGADTA